MGIDSAICKAFIAPVSFFRFSCYNETQNVWALQNMSAVLRHNSIETGNGGVINECKRRRRAAFMRSEKEMMDTIIEVAEKDARIRGVYMNGSRTNPNAPRDVFQDYDIVYVVREISSFREDKEWIDVFGRRLYMQYPDDTPMPGEEIDTENSYGYLMQFADGNRLDLRLATLKYALADMVKDRLCILLLDKDKVLPKIPPSTDMDHWVKKPGQQEYLNCCNEFWWMLNSIGKGIWRGEIPYVMDMLNLLGRPELMKMLSWYVGVNRNFSCSVGKCGKYLDKYLTNEEYERLMETYPGAETEEIWRSVRAMCDLFHETARKVGDGLGYPYNREEAHNSRLYLDCTYEMPKGAETFFMVRRMRVEDVDKTAKIWLEGNLSAHSFIPETYWRENYEGVKGQLAQAEVYTYEDDRGILGFAGVMDGYIAGIFVKENMRSQGIGKALTDFCKEKYPKLTLHVYCENKKAIAFYEREGFVIEKEQTEANTGEKEYEMVWQA